MPLLYLLLSLLSLCLPTQGLPQQALSVKAPSSVLPGTSASLSIQIQNNGVERGYAPFLDIFVPSGIAFSGPSTDSGVPIFQSNVVFGSTYSCKPHPAAIDATNTPLQVCGSNGTLVVCEFSLVFLGDWVPTETLTASLAMPLTMGTYPIAFRSGYIRGSDYLVNPSTDPSLLSSTATAPLSWTVANIAVAPIVWEVYHDATSILNGPSFGTILRLQATFPAGLSLTNVTISGVIPDGVVLRTAPVLTTVLGSTVVVKRAPIVGTTSASNTFSYSWSSISSSFTLQFLVHGTQFKSNGNLTVAEGMTASTNVYANGTLAYALVNTSYGNASYSTTGTATLTLLNSIRSLSHSGSVIPVTTGSWKWKVSTSDYQTLPAGTMELTIGPGQAYTSPVSSLTVRGGTYPMTTYEVRNGALVSYDLVDFFNDTSVSRSGPLELTISIGGTTLDEYSPGSPVFDGDVLTASCSYFVSPTLTSTGKYDVTPSTWTFSVIAVNSVPCACSNTYVNPGDVLTFGTTGSWPTSDVAPGLSVAWQLPLMVDGTSLGSWSATPAYAGITWGAGDNISLAVPSLSTDPAGIRADFTTTNDVSNRNSQLQLYWSLPVLADPFVNGRPITFVLTAQDNNRVSFSYDTLLLNAPSLSVRMGAVLVETQLIPATLTPSCPYSSYWAIGSTGIPSGVLGSNLVGQNAANRLVSVTSGVQAGSRIKFVITIENIGNAPAYDILVSLSSVLPTGLRIPPTGEQLQVTRGDRQSISFIGQSLFDGTGIRIASALGQGLPGYHASTGVNIFLVAFELQANPNATFGSTINVEFGSCNYASLPGGADFTDGLLGKDCFLVNGTTTLARGNISVAFHSSSDPHTTNTSGIPDLSPFELATFRTTVNLPRGSGNLVVVCAATSTFDIESASIESIGSGVSGCAYSVGSSLPVTTANYTANLGLVVVSSDLQTIVISTNIRNRFGNVHGKTLDFTCSAAIFGSNSTSQVKAANIATSVAYTTSQARTTGNFLELDELAIVTFTLTIPHGSNFNWTLSTTYPTGLAFSYHNISQNPTQLVGAIISVVGGTTIKGNITTFTNPNDGITSNDRIIFSLTFWTRPNATMNPNAATRAVASTYTQGSSSRTFTIVLPQISGLTITTASPVDAYDRVTVSAILVPNCLLTIMYNPEFTLDFSPMGSILQMIPGTLTTNTTGTLNTTAVVESGPTSIRLRWPSISVTSTPIRISFDVTISGIFVVFTGIPITSGFVMYRDAALLFPATTSVNYSLPSKVPTVPPVVTALSRNLATTNPITSIVPGETVSISSVYQLLQGYISSASLRIDNLGDYQFAPSFSGNSGKVVTNLTVSTTIAAFSANNTNSASGEVNAVGFSQSFVVSPSRRHGQVVPYCAVGTAGAYSLSGCLNFNIIEPLLNMTLVCTRALSTVYPMTTVNCALNISHWSGSNTPAYFANLTWNLNSGVRVERVTCTRSSALLISNQGISTAVIGNISKSEFVTYNITLRFTSAIPESTIRQIGFFPYLMYWSTPFSGNVDGSPSAPASKLYTVQTSDLTPIPGVNFAGIQLSLNDTLIAKDEYVLVTADLTFAALGSQIYTVTFDFPTRLTPIRANLVSVGSSLTWTPVTINVAQRTNWPIGSVQVNSLTNPTIRVTFVCRMESGFIGEAGTGLGYVSGAINNWENRAYFTPYYECIAGVTCFHGTCIGGYCICGSGYTGPTCNNTEESCIDSWRTLANLLTENKPYLDTGYSGVFNGNLRVRISTPLVINRTATIPYLEDFQLYPACAGAVWDKFIARGYQDDPEHCREVYTLDIPWTQALQCGWDVDTSNVGYLIYHQNIKMMHKDYLDVFRGTVITRDTIHVFPMTIRMQTRVEVSTTLNVFAPIRVLAAINTQTYEPTVSQGNLGITASLQWPFALASPVLVSTPGGMNVSLLYTNVSCPVVGEAACLQQYDLDILPSAACTLSGDYELRFSIICRGSPSECPLDGTETATIVGTVRSENFCIGLSVDIGLAGTLTSYSDSEHLLKDTSFFPNRVVYFQANLTTANTATIQSSRFVDIRVATGALPAVWLMDAYNILPEGAASNLVIRLDSAADKPAFDLQLLEPLFTIPTDESLQFSVTATIEVDYIGGARKRFSVRRQEVIDPGSQPTTVGAEFAVAVEGTDSSAEAQSETVLEGSGLSLGVSLLGLFLLN